jgi:hypothetical protein
MGWVVNATPRPLYPRERPGTRCIGGCVGLRAGLDGCGKSRPPPGFDLRTVKPVSSRYTDCAMPAHIQVFTELICNTWFFCHDYNLVAAHPSGRPPSWDTQDTCQTCNPKCHVIISWYALRQYIVNPNNQEAFLKHTERRYSVAIPYETCPLKHHVSPTINKAVLVSRDLP